MRILALICLAVSFSACQTTVQHDDPLADEVATVEERLSSTEGGQLLLSAINASGGIRAWLESPTSSYTWEYGPYKSRLTADNHSRRIYHDMLDPATDSVMGQIAWDGESAWKYPDTLAIFSARFWSSTGFYFQSIPFVLADSGVRYDVLPEDTLDGVPHAIVKASFDDNVGDSYGDTYTLYLDADSSLVRAIRYTSTYGQGRPAPEEMNESLMYYLDYTTIDGLTVPTRFETYSYQDGVKGPQRGSASASNISYRAPFDEARLIMPEGGAIDPAPNVEN